MKPLKQHKPVRAFYGLVFIALLFTACGNTATPPTTNEETQDKGKDCNNVAVLLPETASSDRWDGKDRPFLLEKIKEVTGQEPTYYNAEGNAETQLNQAETALSQGACILVVAPYSQDGAVAIVERASAQGVPVISYDRMIQSPDIAYYISYDGVRVGEIQGQYIADHYEEYIDGDNKNVVMINGGDTDANAQLFYQGAINVLQPLFDDGSLNKVYDQFTKDWDNALAQTNMEGALTAENNNIQIAYVANDGMANAVIAALKDRQLNQKVLVTGQDATVAGMQNILLGDQMMTVYKDIEQEAQSTADAVKAIREGQGPETITDGVTAETNDGAAIPSVLLEPLAIDKTNFMEVINANYVTKEQVCENLPAGTGGFC